MTFDDLLVRADNRPAGFDYLRLILATSIFATHIATVNLGQAYMAGVGLHPLSGVIAALVPMFFALSGFLIAGSLERCRSIISFLGLRVLRLFPALILDTLIGIAIIGPLFTSLPLSDYIAHPMTHRYALNAIGDVYFYLPGVFAHNPWPELVNGQLWTLPFEMGCYAAITGLALLRLVKTRRRLLLASIGIAIALWIVSLYSPSAGGHIAPQDGRATLAQCFLFGVALYLYRDVVPHRLSWFIVAVIGTNVALIVPQLSYASAPLIVYITMYLGVLHPRRIAIVQSGDYSYGIFLYGFAIQQASVAMLPGSSWVVNTVVAFTITIFVAVLSWRYVEKPALRLRAPLYRLEDRWISFFGKMPFGQLLIARPVPEARPAASGG